MGHQAAWGLGTESQTAWDDFQRAFNAELMLAH